MGLAGVTAAGCQADGQTAEPTVSLLSTHSWAHQLLCEGLSRRSLWCALSILRVSHSRMLWSLPLEITYRPSPCACRWRQQS